MAAGYSGERSLKETPTWAVALVCAVIVVISILIEHVILSLAKWFQKRKKKAMIEALEKIKAELMLLGFISLLLTVGTKYVSRICIPPNLGDFMLPCKAEIKVDSGTGDESDGNDRRKLLSYNYNSIADEHFQILFRRALAAGDSYEDYCSKNNKVPLMSTKGLHQLHIFIFVLAVFHVLYSVITMLLAKAKMRRWKAWELETSSLEYQFSNDPARFRFTRQTSFVKRHSGLSRIPGIRWIVAFFRQFFGSVTKVDYMTMRHGFINAHFSPDAKFDFRKYIKRSMEDDFKMVVGISFPLWIFAIVFLLLNVYNWYTLTWLSVAPVIILLLVGTKLELIIMEMAQEIHDRTTIVKGAPIVEPNNKYFWFNRPQWILLLIHFTLFENAFQMAYFLWTWYEFGLSSCFHEKLPMILTRVFLGLALQIVCSYITFPLYALVTQMGSHMKQTIFEEQTAKALKKWRNAAKERSNKLRKLGENSTGTWSAMMTSAESTPSRGASPMHLLHKHKHRSISPVRGQSLEDLESVVSYRSDLSDLENDDANNVVTIRVLQSTHPNPQTRSDEPSSMDFSFVKP